MRNLLPQNLPRNRTVSRCAPAAILSRHRAFLVAALFATALFCFVANAQAQEPIGAIAGLTLGSETPGTLTVSWDAASPMPTDYRVNWAKSTESYPPISDEAGNLYVEGTSVSLTGLERGVAYKVRVQARYRSGEYADSPWDGPWTEAILEVHADDRQESTPPTPEPTPVGPSTGEDDIAPGEDKVHRPKYPGIDSNLNYIVEQFESGQLTARAAAEESSLYSGGSVAVTLLIDDGYAGAIAELLEENGASARNVGTDFIEAYVPVSLLAEVSTWTGVGSIRTIIPPQPAQGIVVSEGAAAHGAIPWHKAGYRGQGVKIGIIDAGFAGFRALMGTELPSNVNGRCYTDVGAFSSSLDYCDDASFGNHGTAVTETVFDIAPEATYFIANAVSFWDLKETVGWMVEQGVDVINMSLSWEWTGPGDGTSPFSFSPLRSVDQAVDGDILWVNSAGNEATRTWFGPFQDADSNGIHSFGADDECNSMELRAGRLYYAFLRWDDTWGGAVHDLDLFLLTEDESEVIRRSVDLQNGGIRHYPFEYIRFVPEASGSYCLAIYSAGQAKPSWVQLRMWSIRELEHNTLNYSIGSPADSANAGLLAVGATPWNDTSAVEEFSSRGPTPDGRLKPDIVGMDGGRTVTYRSFYGTSQSSPHVAGLAALVKQRFPDFTPQQLAEYLKTNAAPRDAVPNNTWGYGVARLPALGDEQQQPSPDRAALEALYQSTEGHNWTDRTNWATDEPLHMWTGVGVDLNHRVISLFLRENELMGRLPGELGSLSELRRLVLNDNLLTEAIPAELGNLANLEVLTLRDNQLTGEIPAVLGDLSQLRILSIGGNQLTGGIPAELGDLSELWFLGLNGNALTGEVPAELGELSRLEDFYLYSNSLEGTLPHSLTALSRLGNFAFDENSGLCAPDDDEFQTWLQAIPNNDVPEGVTPLGPTCPDPDPPTSEECTETITGSGAFNGNWGAEEDCLSQHPERGGRYARYYTFEIDEETDVTFIVESAEADPYLYIHEGFDVGSDALHENDDHDGAEFTLASSTDSALSVTLQANRYIAEVTTYDDDETGEFTLTVSGLEPADGITPESDRDVLVTLYSATNGTSWRNSENWLTDQALSEWFGVVTDQTGRVTELDLSWNSLSAEIPTELGNLASLEVLSLWGNHLSGTIPGELGNLMNLRELNLSSNGLSGEIPAELGNLANLERIYLSGNDLSGCIPDGLKAVPRNDFTALDLPFCSDAD